MNGDRRVHEAAHPAGRGGALALSLFVLAAAPLAAQEAPTRAMPMPPFATGIDKEAYMRARAEYISLLRGVPTFQSYDARALAIQQMDAVERLRRPDVEIGAWTPLGPNPIPNGQVVTGPQLAVSGRVSAIAVDPTDEDIVYVGAAQGGVYRSLNGGTSWTQIFDGADSLAIGALAIAPSSPTTLYVGTGESALSADSFFGVGVYRIDNATTTADLVGPFNPMVTTGSANTTAFTGRAISEILVHPTLPGTIFVATTSGTSSNPSGSSVGFTVPPLAIRGLYRSTDADTANPSFTKLTVTTAGSIAPDASGDRSITDIAMDPTDPNTMVAWVLGNAAAGDGGVYRSTNALTTATFTQTYTTTTSSSRGELAGNRVGATITFFAASGDASSGQLRRSTDGGATWSAALTAANGFCGGQCFYDIAVAVHPTNANILNVGGAPTFAAGRSTDGGATFTSNATSASGVHGDTHVIAIATALPAVVYLGTDGGIYRSSDSGITWSTLNNSDFYATQFQSLAQHPTDPDFLIGGTQDNGTEFRMPGGAWTRADFGDGGYALIDQNAADTTNVTMYHTYFNQTNAMGFARVTNVASATEGNWTGFGCGFGGFIANGITCTASNILFYAPMALGPGSPTRSTSARISSTGPPTSASPCRRSARCCRAGSRSRRSRSRRRTTTSASSASATARSSPPRRAVTRSPTSRRPPCPIRIPTTPACAER
ncbi:MAG: hypothetical protein R2862_06050 [Thermoanaerobaculia bacterium]